MRYIIQNVVTFVFLRIRKNFKMLKRSPAQYGYVLGYCLEVVCPYCKTKQNFQPRRKKDEIHAKIKNTSQKTCIVCGKKFSVMKNILRERDIKRK